MLWNGDQSPRVKKERKPTLRGKWESVFSGRHMDNVPKETHVVSVMTSKTLDTEAKARDEKDDRLLLASIRRQNRLDGEGQKSSQGSDSKQESSWTRVKFHADSNSIKTRHVSSRHPLVCQNYKSEKGCIYGDKCHFRHVEAEGRPSKKSKQGGAKGSVAILKESFQLGCVSQDAYPRK